MSAMQGLAQSLHSNALGGLHPSTCVTPEISRVGFAIADLSPETGVAETLIKGALQAVAEWHGHEAAVTLAESILEGERAKVEG